MAKNMTVFTDSMNINRAIEFSSSFNPRYINMMLFTDKKLNGDCVQIPREAIPAIIENLKEVMEKC